MGSVGTVSATLTADPAGFEAGIDRGFNALTRLSRGSAEAATSLTRTSQAAQQASLRAESLAKTANTAKEGMSRLAGGLGQMSAAMGSAGGASQGLVNGLTGILGVVGSGGGLLGAGLVAVALAAQLATKALKDQEDQAKATDAAWQKLWASSNKLRDTSEKARGDLAGRFEVEQIKTGNAGSDNVAVMQLAAAKRLEAAETARLDLTRQIEAIGSSLVGLTQAELDARSENLSVLKAQRSVAEGAARDAREEFDLAGKIGGELERQARAAKARAEWDAKALQAQQELASLLRDRALTAEIAGWLPNGGALQTGPLASGSSSLLPGFDQLSTKIDLSDTRSHDERTAENMGHLSESTRALNDEVGSFAINLSRATEAVKDLSNAVDFAAAGIAGTVIGGIAGGNVAQSGGQQVGALAGGLIGSFFGGAALGESIGGALGSILGGTLDNLINALQIFTPMFDGLGVVIKALTPVLLVLKIFFVEIGHTLEMLAPSIHALAEPFAMLTLVVVRAWQTVLPFVDSILLGVAAGLMFLEFMTTAIIWLDTHFFAPLAEGARTLFNGWVDVVNGLVTFMREFLGDDHWGLMLDKMSLSVGSPYDDFATSMEELKAYGTQADDIKDAVAGGAEEGVKQGLQRSMQNLPGGYKGFANVEYASADRSLAPSVVVNIQNWQSSGSWEDDYRRLRDFSRNGTIARSMSRRALPDKKN